MPTYDLTRLLEEATAHNYRIRQLLNRVSASVKEYESIQSSTTRASLSYENIPKELLDSFGHDPAAVTGATRRHRGWRAVEDIQQRLQRQREVFQAFISHSRERSVPSHCALGDSILHLTQTLEVLESHKKSIASTAQRVTSLLESVQEVHVEVKADYYETVSHTSVLYPEVSTYSNVLSLANGVMAAVPHRCFGRKLQRSISTVLGLWYGCSDLVAGHCHSILENLRQNDRGRCSRLSHYTPLSQ